MMCMLRDGEVLIRPEDGQDLKAAVHTGFAVVDSGQVVILAETAELASEIDVDRAGARLARAEASEESPDKIAAVSRAETRLKVVGKIG